MHKPTRLPWLLLAAAAGATGAHAQTSPYYIGASQAFSHSSNLLRLADDEVPPEGFSKADTISSTSLLAGLDQPFGRQRLFGDLAVRSNRLSNNAVYNNTSYALTAGLDWSTAERISGSLKATSNRNLASFNADERGLIQKKNLQDTQLLDAVVRAGVVTELTAELALGWRAIDYSAAEYQDRELRQNSVSLGLRWRPSGGATLGVALRNTSGRYPRYLLQTDGTPLADRFDRRDIDLSATLEPSGASIVNARLSIGKAEHDEATRRDFSGVTGLLGWNWTPTGKLRMDTRLTRDTGSDTYFSSPSLVATSVEDSRLTTALRLRTDYAVSAKVGLNATLTYAHRSLARTPVAGGDALTGSDSTGSIAFGASWSPSRALLFGCDLAQERRRSDGVLSSQYSDTTGTCYGQITLQ